MAAPSSSALHLRSSPSIVLLLVPAPPSSLMDDRARVAQLLGREPQGAFDVVVRDHHGDPVVVRNAPFLDDGTPMPTRFYLVGADLVRE